MKKIVIGIVMIAMVIVSSISISSAMSTNIYLDQDQMKLLNTIYNSYAPEKVWEVPVKKMLLHVIKSNLQMIKNKGFSDKQFGRIILAAHEETVHYANDNFPGWFGVYVTLKKVDPWQYMSQQERDHVTEILLSKI